MRKEISANALATALWQRYDMEGYPAYCGKLSR